MEKTLKWACALAGLAALAGAATALALAGGGPAAPLPLASVNEPFKAVDFSALPPPLHFTARDGSTLAYRLYGHAGAARLGSVVLVHGSSSRGASLHPLAWALSQAGYDSHALDMRGHGDSGPHGQIGYIGQLEDDVEDFLLSVQPAAPRTLIGFSSGGGFALRFAADDRQGLFDRYLLLAPFVGPDAPTYRENSGGWVTPGLPRLAALALLNRLGITTWNHLRVLRFALDERAAAQLTAAYSYSLALNFRPHLDWRADIRAVRRPMSLIVGDDDEMFDASRFPELFHDALPPIPVVRVAGLGHMALTLADPGHRAVIQALATPP